jgi:hypothetical protein
MAQVVECLLSKRETLSSIPNSTKKKVILIVTTEHELAFNHCQNKLPQITEFKMTFMCYLVVL